MKRRATMLVGMAAAVVLFVSCGSSDNDDSGVTGSDTEATVEVAEPALEAEESEAQPDAQDSDQPPAPPADGRYEVGDTYFDVDLSATHLGLAQVPVGPDIFTGGSCYTVLVEVNRYADTIGLGPEKFQASTTGLLTDGTEAESDSTGVGCDMLPLAELGYERSIDTGLDLGDSKQAYLGAIHVPDGATLDGVQLYGSPDTFFVADVTVDATG